MAASPFQAALEALLRPLEFAARDDYAALERVRDLGPSVVGGARAVVALSVPREIKPRLDALAGRFEADLGERAKDAVSRALAALRPLAEPAWSDAALARSPAVLPGIGPKTAQALARRGLASVGACSSTCRRAGTTAERSCGWAISRSVPGPRSSPGCSGRASRRVVDAASGVSSKPSSETRAAR